MEGGVETGPGQEKPSHWLDTSVPTVALPGPSEASQGPRKSSSSLLLLRRPTDVRCLPQPAATPSSAGASEASPAAGGPTCSLGLPRSRGRRGAKPSSRWVLPVPCTDKQCAGPSVSGPEERPGRSKRAFQPLLPSPACFFTSKPFHQSKLGAWQGRLQ